MQKRWNKVKPTATALSKTLDILSPVLIYCAGYYICGILLAIIRAAAAGKSAAAGAWIQQNAYFLTNLTNACAMLCGAGLLLPCYHSVGSCVRTEHECSTQGAHFAEKRAEKTRAALWLPDYVRLAILAGSCALGMNILFARLHLTEAASYEQTAQIQYQLPFLAGLLIYGVISPFAEELLFRGCIYQRMKKYFPVKVSLLVSACLFGLYHGNPVQMLYATVLGIGITYVYELSGQLKTAVFVHGIANTTVFACTYDALRGEALGTWSVCAVCFALFFITLWSLVKSVLDPRHGSPDRRQQQDQDRKRAL